MCSFDQVVGIIVEVIEERAVVPLPRHVERGLSAVLSERMSYKLSAKKGER